MRLIDADALKAVFEEKSSEAVCGVELCKAIISRIDEAQTVDAEHVRHGKWIDMDEQSYTWKVRCSVCGHERSMMSTHGEYPNYCENCGARMDEVEE